MPKSRYTIFSYRSLLQDHILLQKRADNFSSQFNPLKIKWIYANEWTNRIYLQNKF